MSPARPRGPNDEQGPSSYPPPPITPRVKHGTGQKHAPSIGLVLLIFITFNNVSGGPYGSEELIKSAGPLWAVVALLIVPFVYCLPVSLLTAELSCMFPVNGSYNAWVEEAFGSPLLAFLEGYLSWVGGVADNAIYPGLAISYVAHTIGESGGTGLEPYQEWLVKAAIATALSSLVLCGLRLVGVLQILLVAFALAPFAFLCAMSIPQGNFENATKGRDLSAIDWPLFVQILVWNLSGWDASGSFAAEVRAPKRTYPLGMVVAVAMVVVILILPIVASTAVDTAWDNYDEGYYARIAAKVGGNGLAMYLMLSAGIGSLGMYVVDQIIGAWMLQGMAQTGLVPAVLGTTNKQGTPWVGVVVSLLVMFVLLIGDFNVLVEVGITLYSLCLLLECASFIVLRWTRRKIQREFTVPPPTVFGGLLIVLGPTAVCCLQIALTQLQTKLFTLGMVLTGAILYLLFAVLRKFKLLRYVETSGNGATNPGESDPLIDRDPASYNTT